MKPHFFLASAICAILLTGTIAPADELMLPLIPENQLRTIFEFAPDDGLKMAACDGSRTFTCTYIWGAPDEDDALRIELGAKPDGKRLYVIAARAARASDFDRVLAVYKDAVPVADLGVQAVWSEKRGQLSILTADNKVIHVNTDMTQSDDQKAAAITIANLVLATP
ncbi:hypothetical protein [Falsihalocynthiibacter arcticus]|uniref:DUF4367 domain-containing protein n=1 Tax=Falsihalocynthiibacter arcticus TaxID=1579316 RepID=A0A126V166_9RHOB|nr:hypothetical protein [Falsihalocynthiibacter arcticus]AML52068.1 hypothetical protein RC74_13000 [Falsihalocynthiibacter arcticus]